MSSCSLTPISTICRYSLPARRYACLAVAGPDPYVVISALWATVM